MRPKPSVSALPNVLAHVPGAAVASASPVATASDEESVSFVPVSAFIIPPLLLSSDDELHATTKPRADAIANDARITPRPMTARLVDRLIVHQDSVSCAA